MATPIVEQVRLLHEEAEACERRAAELLSAVPAPYKEALSAKLRAAAVISQAQRVQLRLEALYADVDGAWREEREAVAADTDLSLFYASLAAATARAAAPSVAAGLDAAPPESVTIAAEEDAMTVLQGYFGADEVYGKYIDLSAAFHEWCNLPVIKDARNTHTAVPDFPHALVDYIAYLRKFSDLHVGLPRRIKVSRAARAYLSHVCERVVTFFTVTNPLVDVGELLDSIAEDFVQRWTHGGSAAWIDGSADAPEPGHTHTHTQARADAADADECELDLSGYASAQAILNALGPERTRRQCALRGLKLGGTPLERAERLAATRGLTREQYPKKIRATEAHAVHAGAAASDAPAVHAGRSLGGAASTSGLDAVLDRVIVRLQPIDYGALVLARAGLDVHAHGGAVLVAWGEEVACRFVCDILGETVNESRRRVEKRQTRTPAEIAKERQMEEEEVSFGVTGPAIVSMDDEEEEGPIYNPLNVPLGWDGKPIPLWLFKLHQLHIEYKCEICGGESYRGRRNFDRHFQESRHAFGMRVLGIPNTKHFHDITRVEDARALYEKLSATLGKEVFRAEVEEEFEDSMGNVLNRKTYEDLARQGLL